MRLLDVLANKIIIVSLILIFKNKITSYWTTCNNILETVRQLLDTTMGENDAHRYQENRFESHYYNLGIELRLKNEYVRKSTRKQEYHLNEVLFPLIVLWKRIYSRLISKHDVQKLSSVIKIFKSFLLIIFIGSNLKPTKTLLPH